MKILTATLILSFTILANAAAENRMSKNSAPAKCQTRWMMQATLSPLISSLGDPTLIECGKGKEKNIGEVEERLRLSNNLRGAGPRND